MVPDNGEATTVGGSPAHNAWVSGSSGADAGAAPAAAEPVVATPAPAAAPAPAPGLALPADATLARPGEKSGTIADASKAFLNKHKAADRTKPNAPAPAAASASAPAASASSAAAAASPAAVAGAEKAGAAAASAAVAAGATPAQAQAAGEGAAQEFLEALDADGQPFKIPVGVKIPIKVNGKVEHVSILEAQKRTMLESDYRRKTTDVANDRRALVAEQARIKAEQDQLAADRKQYEEAQLDPDKFEQYTKHLEMLRDNPVYKENWERGRAAQLDTAELNAFRGAEAESVVQSAAESVLQTLNSLSSEYPGVDPASVRAEYANDLTQGRAELTEASLRSYFAKEAQRVTRYTGPLTKQIEDLKATVDSLAKAKAEETAATTHNDQTRRAIDRDQMGRFTSPAGGAAPDVNRDPAPKPFTSSELPARNKAWVDKGRGELRRGA